MKQTSLLKLAVFSPVNPVRSGISDYMEALFPYLENTFSIDLFLDGYHPSSPALQRAGVFYRRDFEWKNRIHPYDVILYQLGNSRIHQYLYPNIFRYPGVIILHEVNLHRARAFEHLSKGKLGDYLSEMAFCHGDPGTSAAEIIARGYHSQLLYDLFPMLNLICRSADTIIVHNQYAESVLSSMEQPPCVELVHAPLIDTELPDTSTARKRLGISPDTYIIASFGFIAQGKELLPAINAFSRFAEMHPDSRYILVGDDLERGYSRRLLSTLPPYAAGRILITGFVPDAVFKDYLAAADVCINLRYPSQGETSSSLLRAMGAGKPVIVSRYRQFRELPRGTCLFIDPWPDVEESIFQALKILFDLPVERRRIGQSGRNFIRARHDMDRWGKRIVEILKKKATRGMRKTPLAYGCPLPHVSVVSLAEHLAASLVNWGKASSDMYVARCVSEAVHSLVSDNERSLF